MNKYSDSLKTANSSDIFSCEISFVSENVKTVLVTQDSDEVVAKGAPLKTSFLHVHSCYEFFCCTDGNMRFCFDNEAVNLYKNQMIVIAPKIYHALTDAESGTHSEALLLDFSDSGVSTDMDLYGLLKKQLPQKYIVYDINPGIEDLFCSVVKNAESRDVFSLSGEIHSFLMAMSVINSNDAPSYSVKNNDNSNIRLHRIYEVIYKYIDNITLEKTSEELHLSCRQTSRIIKENYGCTFKKLVARFRMQKATEYLSTTSMSILDIANAVGYSSVTAFYSAFKNRYGILPAEYRKNRSDFEKT